MGLDQLRVAQLQQLSFIIFLRSLWRLVVQLETHGVIGKFHSSTGAGY
jgi:hypothetical protein